MARDASLNPPPWNGQAVLIAELWTLHKAGRRAVCSLWTHQDGAELRLDVDGRGSRSLCNADFETLLDIAVRWNTELIASAGWVER